MSLPTIRPCVSGSFLFLTHAAFYFSIQFLEIVNSRSQGLLSTSASGPPPPAAPSSSRRRRRRQESDRLPVQGRAAAACAKLGYPKAALAACCPPSRPRRILRSPCRRAAISDKRLRNLPKCAGPEMAEPGRSGAREAGDGRHFPDCARRAAKASGSAAGLA